MVGLESHMGGFGVRSRVWDVLSTAQTVRAPRMILFQQEICISLVS